VFCSICPNIRQNFDLSNISRRDCDRACAASASVRGKTGTPDQTNEKPENRNESTTFGGGMNTYWT